MDISVIVPIYNVEKYIERCLRSLFEQTMTDGVEFILVNDCTPDRSVEIARKISGEYPQLTIIILEHTENRGVAATRQTGINAAVGEYTIQIDSDDRCELNMLEEMYAKAIDEDADIVACDLFGFEDKHIRDIHSADRIENLNRLILGQGLTPSLCTRLIKRDLYVNHSLKCDNGINCGEDTLIMPMLYYFANKVSYHPKAYLHYTLNLNSITHSVYTGGYCLDHMKIISIWTSFFQSTPDYSKIKHSIDSRKALEKHHLLKITRGKEQQHYNKLFPIKSSIIFGAEKIAFSAKATLFLAGIGLLPLSNLLYCLGDKLNRRNSL